jgi:hypothetical protein
MRKYPEFKYQFPPRPENKIRPTTVAQYENGQYIAQPKLNGSCGEIYLREKEIKLFDRHAKEGIHLFCLADREVRQLYTGKGWMMVSGEYMNKNQKDENHKPWNHKFVIWDLIIYNGQHLVKETFENRIQLMDDIFGMVDYNSYLYKITENIYRVKTFTKNFHKLYEAWSPIDMVEGLVLKRKNAKLERGSHQKNNVLSQVKVRKPTKNYEF